MGRLTVFTDQHCIESLKVKSYLHQVGLSCVEIDLSLHPGRRKDMYSLTDSQTTPKLFLNETLVASGLHDLRDLVHVWVMQHGSIDAAFKRLVGEVVVSDPRLRVPMTSTVIQNPQIFGNISIFVPQMQKNIGIAALTRLLLQHMPKNHDNSFRGLDAIDAIQKWLKVGDLDASKFGALLLAEGLMDCTTLEGETSLNTNMTYRLHALKSPQVLNMHCPVPKKIFPEGQILTRLCQVMQTIYAKYSAREVRLQSPEYEIFQEHVGLLRRIPKEDLRTADFINLYNLMVRHGMLEYPSWNENSWKHMLGVIRYQLANNAIIALSDLSGILLPPYKRKLWKRLAFWRSKAVQDERIQYCLSWGFKSSPPICRIYTRGNLEWEIEETTRYYFQNSVKVLKDKLILPNAELKKRMDWLVRFLSSEQLVALQNLHQSSPKGITIEVEPFDWNRIDYAPVEPFRNRMDFMPINSPMTKEYYRPVAKEEQECHPEAAKVREHPVLAKAREIPAPTKVQSFKSPPLLDQSVTGSEISRHNYYVKKAAGTPSMELDLQVKSPALSMLLASSHNRQLQEQHPSMLHFDHAVFPPELKQHPSKLLVDQFSPTTKIHPSKLSVEQDYSYMSPMEQKLSRIPLEPQSSSDFEEQHPTMEPMQRLPSITRPKKKPVVGIIRKHSIEQQAPTDGEPSIVIRPLKKKVSFVGEAGEKTLPVMQEENLGPVPKPHFGARRGSADTCFFDDFSDGDSSQLTIIKK